MTYQINFSNLEAGCNELMRLALNRLENSLVEDIPIQEVLTRIQAYINTRALLPTTHMQYDIKGYDEQFQAHLTKFNQLCAEMNP